MSFYGIGKSIGKFTKYFIVFCLVSIFIAEFISFFVSHKSIYQDIEEIPHNNVGLLLGTNKTYGDGYENLFYTYRINTTVELYKENKIEYILATGDNGSEGYDEATAMKDSLLEQGIPENKIYLDYAGFRTLDSIVRAKEVFGQGELTVISQKFHLERALVLAKSQGIEAIGFSAKDVPVKRAPKVWIRERLARVKMLLDILIGVEPKFLGDKIEIPS